jgi:hypothetical protein
MKQPRLALISVTVLLAVLIIVLAITLNKRPRQTQPPSQPTSGQQQTPEPTPIVDQTAPTYADPYGYGFDVPSGYGVTRSTSAQFDQWIITAKPTSDMEQSLPEMEIISVPGNTPLKSQDDSGVISTQPITINGLVGLLYATRYTEGVKCPMYELIGEQRTYRFMLHECLDSKIYEQVVHSFRKGPVPVADNGMDVSIRSSFTLKPGETANVTDKGQTVAVVTLNAINDSRCKPGVQCIWAGELAAEVTYKHLSEEPRTLHLGKMTKSCSDGLALESITETNATFTLNAMCN